MLRAQDIEDALKGVKGSDSLTSIKDVLTKNLGLSRVGEGINRIVYKVPKSRSVFKICPYTEDQPHNIAEYTLYQGLEGDPLQNILCPILDISRNGRVLQQKSMPLTVPYDSHKTLQPLEKLVLESFQFIRRLPYSSSRELILDMHPDNIMMTRNYDLKIVDYSTLLYVNAMNSKFNRVETIDKIRNMRKRGAPIVLYLDAKGGLAGRTQEKVVTMYEGFSHEEIA